MPNICRQFNIWKHVSWKIIWRWLVLLLHSIFIVCSIGCQKIMLLNSQENNIIHNKNINSSSYSHMYEESWNKTSKKNYSLKEPYVVFVCRKIVSCKKKKCHIKMIQVQVHVINKMHLYFLFLRFFFLFQYLQCSLYLTLIIIL